jgi:hypothetical protein
LALERKEAGKLGRQVAALGIARPQQAAVEVAAVLH